MIITSNLVDNSIGQTNPIFAGCCGLVEIKVKLSNGEPTRSIHRIHINNTGGCSTTILEVNGVAWNDPLTYTLTLNSLNEITCLLQVCSDCDTAVGHITSFDFEVHWNSPGSGSQVWTFDMINIDTVTNPVITQTTFNWHPCLNDCTLTQGDFFIVNNPTPFTINVGFSTIYLFTGDLNWFIDGIASGTGTGVSLPIPPGEHTVGIQTCPLDLIENDTIYFDVTNCGQTYPVDVYYQPVYCGTCGISCRGLDVYSDGYLITINNLCDVNSIVDRFSIGANISLQWRMTYVNLQAGQKFYFNPVLFGINCNFASFYPNGIIDSAPATGWFFDLNSNALLGGSYPMTMYGTGVNANSQKNLSVQISFIDSTNFTIDFNFYMIEDIEQWISNIMLANQPKLLNSHVSAPMPLTNVVQSVYNSIKQLCLFTYMTDSNIQVNGNDFGCYLTKSLPWTSRFWNQGLNSGVSEFSNPQFKFKRNGVFVPGFSTVQQTEVIFEIDSPSMPYEIYIWLFDTSKTDNFNYFTLNYNSSRINIYTDPGNAQVNNLIWSPMVGVTNLGLTNQIKFTVDTAIDPTGQWRIGAIVYGISGLQIISNSFISDEIPVTEIPGVELCCSLTYSMEWSDYSRTYINECFAPTMKERIKNVMYIQGGSFNTCLIDYGMNPANLWIDYLKKVTLNIYQKVLNYPTTGQTTFFVFDSMTSNRIIGFPGNWQNLNSDLQVSDNGTILTTEWNGRVRYEDTTTVSNSNVFVANTATAFTRLPAGPLASTYISVNNINLDWADKDIYFEYTFEFDLSPIYGQPCTFNIVRTNLIHPVDYETNPLPYSQLLKSIVVKGWKNGVGTTINGPFCDGAFEYLEIEVQDLGSPTLFGSWTALIDKFPFGVGNLIEVNGSTPTATLPQLTNPVVYDIDTNFNGDAKFKIDLSLLGPGQYQICGLYLQQP